jgi:lysozyme family protein
MADFEPAVTKTIRREGGDTLTDDPDDPGGLTRYGISKRAHPEVDPRNLSLEGAKAIYRKDYWDLCRGDEITSQLKAEVIFDSAVNMGVNQAVRLAQIAMGIEVDGEMGPATIAGLNNPDADPTEFAAAFALAKITRYLALVKKNRKLEKYFYGWVRRTLEVS